MPLLSPMRFQKLLKVYYNLQHVFSAVKGIISITSYQEAQQEVSNTYIYLNHLRTPFIHFLFM